MNSKKDMWLLTYSRFFPAENMHVISEKIANLPEAKSNLLYALPLKNPTTSVVLSLFLGYIGVDRFYIGDVGLGITKLLTFGWLWVGAWIDIYFCQKKAKEINMLTLMKMLNYHAQ